ncbi:MAG: 2-dehydropantoate 2-reductase [Chloroflexota bacterium]|nr:2-dehydropantoate 2-reductase [Chloroflexota bacterium]
MKVAVVGTGGLGGYFGARLAQGGHDVHFIARGAHLAAMREGGLQIRSVFGDFALKPTETHATDEPASIGPSQVVLFTVKSYDTETAAASLPSLLGPETAVISLQNGIDNDEKLASRIGWEHVAGGVAYIFAGIAEPGIIRHTGGPARILFGEIDGRRTSRLEAFLAACQRSGIDADLIPDIRVALWSKYAFICAQAGLTAATRQPIGAVRESPRTWELFRDVLEEAVSTGRAEGVPLPDDVAEGQLALATNLDASLYSSLHDDLVAGRRMELEALLGELVRRAERAGVPAPASSALYAVLLPQANALSAAPQGRSPGV